jgi:hypothetical protein
MTKYTYYQSLESEEHMLFATEIAKLYNLMLANQPRNRLVSSVLRRYIKNHLPSYESFYYKTKYGLVECFPEWLYKPAMDEYLKEA